MLAGAILLTAPLPAQQSADAAGSDSAGTSVPERLTLPGVIPRVLDYDSGYRQSLLDEASARAGRALARARVLPQISLSPGQAGASYAWSRGEETRTVPDASQPGNPTATTTESVLTNTHSASAQLSLNQALPTDGSLSLVAGNTLRARVVEEEEAQYRQSLSFSATWQQPLFTNRRVIDLRVFGAGIELSGGIPLRIARSNAALQKNARIVGVLETYLQVVELRKQVDLLSANIASTAERVEQVRIRRRQGTATQRDVWDVEITLEELRESRLQAQYALRQAESSLAASLGLPEGVSSRSLADEVPELSLPAEEEIVALAGTESDQVAQARESLNQARLQRIVNGRQYAATLQTSVNVAPAYDPGWTENSFGSEDLGESYAELFTEEASWDTTVSVSLNVPLYNGGQRRHQASRDQAAIDGARISLEDTRRSVVENIRSLYLRRRLLRDQLTLRENSLRLEEDRLDEKERLAELDSLTELELQEARNQVRSRENALWRTRADLFLNGLRILQAAGRDLEDLVTTAQSGAEQE